MQAIFPKDRQILPHILLISTLLNRITGWGKWSCWISADDHDYDDAFQKHPYTSGASGALAAWSRSKNKSSSCPMKTVQTLWIVFPSLSSKLQREHHQQRASSNDIPTGASGNLIWIHMKVWIHIWRHQHWQENRLSHCVVLNILEGQNLRNIPVAPYSRKCLAKFSWNQKETALLLMDEHEI